VACDCRTIDTPATCRRAFVDAQFVEVSQIWAGLKLFKTLKKLAKETFRWPKKFLPAYVVIVKIS
jgi:hypothetical protein